MKHNKLCTSSLKNPVLVISFLYLKKIHILYAVFGKSFYKRFKA